MPQEQPTNIRARHKSAKVAAVPAPPEGATSVCGFPTDMVKRYAAMHDLTVVANPAEASVLFIEDTGLGGMLRQLQAYNKPIRAYIWDAKVITREDGQPRNTPKPADAAAHTIIA